MSRKPPAHSAPSKPTTTSDGALGGKLGLAAGLLALFCVALALRSWGITWGLPGSERYYAYHPDETVLLHAICQTNPLWGDFTPDFYAYGSFTILLTRLAYDFLSSPLGWGPVPRYDQPDFSLWVGDYAHLLLLGRWITAILGAATVWPVFLTADRLYDRRAAWIAAALAALCPMGVVLGHYLTVDVPSAFFSTATLAAAATAAAASVPAVRRRAMLTAALLCGIGVGIKYSVFPWFLALVPVLLQGRREPADRKAVAIDALLILGVGAAGFLIATPGALLQPDRFIADVSQELRYNREGMGLLFQATLPAPLQHLLVSLPIGLEIVPYALALVGLFLAARRRRTGDAILLIAVAVFFLAISGSARSYVRYVAPILPPLLILAAAAVSRGMETRYRLLWIAAGGLAMVSGAASSIAHAGVFAAPDSRDATVAALRSAARAGDTVALAFNPWFQTPPLHPTAGCVLLGQVYGGPPIWERSPGTNGAPFDLGPFHVLASPSNTGALTVEALDRYAPRFVVLTDYDDEDAERIHAADPTFRSGILDLKARLKTGYRLHQEFRPRPTLGPLVWWRSGTPPHDWRYMMPTVRIYESAAER